MADQSKSDVAQRSKPAKKEKPSQEPKAKAQSKKKIEGAALIGIDIAKGDDLAEWYQQVITKGKMIDFYDVSGCYILLPASYAIWESIKSWFDAKIKTIGVKNCYFPIFISEANLQKEKEHIEGFAAEVAWVTKGYV
jgi:prolyl-tRNA synthetase